MSVEKEMIRYVLQHYGNLISVGEPVFDDRTKTWVAQLKTDYPRLIQDDRSPNDRILKFLSMRRLGIIRLSEDLKPIEASTRDECIQTLNTFLRIWQDRAEKIVVAASSDRLAKIGETHWVLAPVRMIMSNLLRREVIPDEEIQRLPPKGRLKMEQYFGLLESLDLVRRTNYGYTYGNLFTALREKTRSFEDFNTAVLSHVIRERYPMLRDVFDISQLETFVHVDSCYYKPALEAEKILYQKRDSIIYRYTTLYGRKSPIRLTYILDELVSVNALHYSDKYYYGDDDLFQCMMEMKNEMQELAPPSIGTFKRT